MGWVSKREQEQERLEQGREVMAQARQHPIPFGCFGYSLNSAPCVSARFIAPGRAMPEASKTSKTDALFKADSVMLGLSAQNPDNLCR